VIRLTPRGRRLIAEVEEDYTREVERIMGALKRQEVRSLIGHLEQIRGQLAP
jgi:DNA-binding MarR family transcriptional regulator